MCFFDINVLVELQFYNYSIAFYNYPTIRSSITTSLTHYGSYRTVVLFDPPTQNTIIAILATS